MREDHFKHVKLGLIGTGRWGKNYIKTMHRMENIQLCWLASQNPSGAGLAPSGCQFTTHWQDMLSDDHLDGVIIATPPALHAEMVLAALKVGLGVMVEKPLTLDLEEALSLYEAARQYKGYVLVDHTYLFHPAYRKLKEIAPAQGSVVRLRSVSGNWGPFRSGFPVLWDWAAHDLAMCLDFLGQRPENLWIQQLEAKQVDKEEGAIYSIRLGFEGGVQADISVGNLMANKSRLFEAYFKDRLFTFDDTSSEKLKSCTISGDRRLDEKVIWTDSKLPLTGAVMEFAMALRSNDHNLSSLQLGLDVIRTLSQLQDCLTQSKPLE